MAQLPASKRTASLSGSSRLSLSVPPVRNSAYGRPGRHPLKHEWAISYVHRPPGAKGIDYEKEIKKVATFGSIESFLHLYSHLTPPNALPPITDVLVFLSRIGRPGVWEEMRDGGKFTLRLVHPITPLLYESLLLALLGDQFEEADSVVGCVLSVRQSEDILSVWVEQEGEGVRSGSLKEKILSLLGLPQSTICEYRANRTLLDAASHPSETKPYPPPVHHPHHVHTHHSHHAHHTHAQPHHANHHHIPSSAERREAREPRGPAEGLRGFGRDRDGEVRVERNGWGRRGDHQ
ncbi:hypothetical protein M231_05431 [Tremella mesenterica]|uniref:Translation initiation factor 4E n=1 Tax=Tremella mesenterica TaxID=5217 RepID=A0A4Q1BI36_TREME|nr:uncharacterized protein TREMEDRAFT_44880 [Tremella mesenterica DSM 1558]EIW67875.1 hypothetical protein TREMEDRAFT_44880 [Tremella mesenterica DSM 1558]RXK37289.1 hypothetical protein M231_05431 [Tremella mesenterica]